MSEKSAYKAVNWNTPDNDYVLFFWEQNLKQFWIDTEFTPSNDVTSWKGLPPNMREAYKKALGGLTLLDTLQSNTGMAQILQHVDSQQNQAVLSYMCMMEAIHAKSYSTIFTTVATGDEVNEIFKWVEENKYLQRKAQIIDKYYNDIIKGDKNSFYKALVASVALESFLFYSGFFLPLWLCGQGEMVASSDIIKKIIADESIHGLFVGVIAQEIFNEFDPVTKVYMEGFVEVLFNELYENELKYTETIYSEIGLTPDVKAYLKYNYNKAMMNLGFPAKFENVVIDPLVLNGLNTETTQHDFFSKKSTNYEKSLEVVHLKSDDFNFQASDLKVL